MKNKKAYKFGLEIELGFPDAVSVEDVQDAVYKINKCDLKDDGSLSFDDCEIWTAEIVTRPLGYNLMARTITKLSKYFAAVDATSNRSCGIHFHCSNARFFKVKNLKKIMSTWLAIEDVLFATQPGHRLNNRYCQRLLGRFVGGSYPEHLPTAKSALISEAGHMDRYCALNLNALQAHGTLEVRLFANTLNADKLHAYLELVRAIYDYALTRYDHAEIVALMASKISETKVQRVWKMLNLSEKTTALLTARVHKSLFDALGRQQESANKYLELRVDYKKKDAEYRKASDAYNEIRRKIDDIMYVFRYRDNSF